MNCSWVHPLLCAWTVMFHPRFYLRGILLIHHVTTTSSESSSHIKSPPSPLRVQKFPLECLGTCVILQMTSQMISKLDFGRGALVCRISLWTLKSSHLGKVQRIGRKISCLYGISVPTPRICRM